MRNLLENSKIHTKLENLKYTEECRPVYTLNCIQMTHGVNGEYRPRSGDTFSDEVPQQAAAGQNYVNRELNAENNGREEENGPDAELLNIEANVAVWSENEINRLTLQQRQSLPDKMICLICLENVRDAVFRGCGHFLVCKYCMMLYVHCPMCDIKIKAWDGASWDL